MLVLAFVILVLGAMLQAAVGCGMGMFAIPLLVWCRFSLAAAIGLVVPVVLIQTGFNCWQHRHRLPWTDVVPVLAARLTWLPVGLWALMLLDHSGTAMVKRVLGVTIIVALVLQLGIRVRPRSRVPLKWGVLAGSMSGLMAGMVGMGGPPLVLWLMAHDWEQWRSRTFLWLSIFLMLPVHISLLAWIGGPAVRVNIVHGLWMAPAGVAGGWIGNQIGETLSKQRLRVAMIGVLCGIAVYSIVRP